MKKILAIFYKSFINKTLNINKCKLKGLMIWKTIFIKHSNTLRFKNFKLFLIKYLNLSLFLEPQFTKLLISVLIINKKILCLTQ